MRPTAVTILGAVVASGAVILLCRACPTHAKRPGGAMRVVEPVPSEVSAIDRRARIKGQLARRVIAERIPLLRAAELFDSANGEDGTHVVRAVPGQSLREKVCRQVIFYVLSAESEIAQEGGTLPEPRVSAELQVELDRRIEAGEFPPEPQ